MDFDDLDDVEGPNEEEAGAALEDSLLEIIAATGAPEALKDFLLEKGLTTCQQFFTFVSASDADAIKVELEKNVALQLRPPADTLKEQVTIRNAWKRCRVAVEEEEAAQEAARGPAEETKVMKPLRDMTDKEFAAVPKLTPPDGRPRYGKKLWKEKCDMELPGRHFGFTFPHTLEDLKDRGPKWLTKAFHAAGTIPKDNSVKSMKVVPLSLDPLAGDALGGSSIKCRIEVEYEKPDRDLHTKFFGKMPLIPTDVCERFEHHKWFMDEAEVMFDRLVSPACPFRTPKTYFVDHNVESTNFIHIYEWIEYAEVWEPTQPGIIGKANQKVFDTEVPKLGVERYMGLMRSLAKLVAAFQNDQLGTKSRLAQCFEGLEVFWTDRPSPWPQTDEEWHRQGEMAKAKEYQDSIVEQATMNANLSQFQMNLGIDVVVNVCPQIFPKECKDPKFMLSFLQEVMHVQRYNVEINWYMTQYSELFSLFHPNTQIDNAFYMYTDKECTKMEAGIFDWAGVKCMPYLMPIAGNLQSGGENEMLEEHEEGLVRCWLDTYHESGGSQRITWDLIFTGWKLASCMSVPGVMGFINNVMKDTPKTDPFWKSVEGFETPEIMTNFMKRVNLGAMVHQIQAWKSPKRRLYATFLEWQQKYKDVVFEKAFPSDLSLPKPK